MNNCSSQKNFNKTSILLIVLLILISATMTSCSFDCGKSKDIYTADEESTDEKVRTPEEISAEIALKGGKDPLEDLFYFVDFIVEIAKFGRMIDFVDIMQKYMTSNPAKADQMLIAYGDFIRALESSELSLEETSKADSGGSFLPMISSIFTISNTSGKSTARLIADSFRKLGDDKYEIPEQLQRLIIKRGVFEKVDYSKPRCKDNDPRYYDLSPNDNRSDFERLIEFLDSADCGYIGSKKGQISLNNMMFAMIKTLTRFKCKQEGTITEVFSYAMSYMSTGTASVLVDLVNIFNSIPLLGKGMITFALETIGCTDEQAKRIAIHMPVMKALAKSGGIDWMMPVARVFREQGQMNTLISIFKILASDLRLDEDGKASTKSILRRVLPALNNMINKGVITSILQNLDIFYTMPTDKPGETAADLVIDTVSMFVASASMLQRDDKNLSDADKDAKYMTERLKSVLAGPRLKHINNFTTEYVTKTVTVNGKRKLAHPNVRLLVSSLLRTAHDSALAEKYKMELGKTSKNSLK